MRVRVHFPFFNTNKLSLNTLNIQTNCEMQTGRIIRKQQQIKEHKQGKEADAVIPVMTMRKEILVIDPR